ncbi:MAG: hypothetical protein KDK12_04080 [Rhodobacteraceae bacterium]|nr:hypothetical protein [Paracoccaceae bacterium]
MPRHFKAARLWTAVAAAALIAGTVSAMDHGVNGNLPVNGVVLSTAI